jgi:hypothetical protein
VSGGWRALAVVLALALALACAVMVIAMIDIGDDNACDDVANDPELLAEFQQVGGECLGDLEIQRDGDVVSSGSAAQRTITLVLGWPSGVLAGAAALVALAFAATGRYGRLMLLLTGAAIVLGAISILVGSV